MLTRLTIDGFKNLSGVDVRFGPFTCVAGANGAGKSNLFDAIAFLAALADRPLAEAAASVRGLEGRPYDVQALFRRDGAGHRREMVFGAEMIIPAEGTDELGAKAKAGATFLRYALKLGLRSTPHEAGPLEVLHESMHYIPVSKAKVALPFPHSDAWREAAIQGRRTVPYIDTEHGDRTLIVTPSDSKGDRGGGRPRKVAAEGLPRTVLSSVNNAAEYRTLLLARKEMLGWSQLQLEPSALRSPDELHARAGVGHNGAHLPATLRGLIREAAARGDKDGENLRAELSNRLAGLIREVRDLRVEEDDRRNTVTLVLRDLAGTDFSASQLSDGTLRFIAIALLQADRRGPGVLCFEEPENGIHPRRIRAMLDLLDDYATDPHEAVDASNPLRQVIVNTHSPGVVGEVDDAALIVAVTPGLYRARADVPPVSFRPLPRTWRARSNPDAPVLTRSELLDYLVPVREAPESGAPRVGRQRVADVPELQMPLFGDLVAEPR